MAKLPPSKTDNQQRSLSVSNDILIKKSTIENDNFKLSKRSNILALMFLCLTLVGSLSFDPYYNFLDALMMLNIEGAILTFTIGFIYYNSFKKMYKRHKIVMTTIIGWFAIYALNIASLIIDIPYKNYQVMFITVPLLVLSVIYFIVNHKK